MTEFLTVDQLASFAGLVLATGLVVEAIKFVTKSEDLEARILTTIIGILLTGIFAGEYHSIQSIVLTLLNGLVVSITASGGYEYIVDPKAEKE